MSGGPIEELVATKGVAVVRKLAKQFAATNALGLDEDDFISLGHHRLVEVAPDYSEVERVKFTTYIFPHVRGAMQDAVRRKHAELTVQGLIEQEIERDARRFASRQSDDFDVVFDPPEVNRARCHETLSDLAVLLATTAAAATVRLMRRGTEDHLGELDAHALLVETITRTVATLPVALQRLWQLYYVEESTLKDYAAELGISDATAGRYHQALRDTLREVLLGAGISGMPDVE